MDLKFWRALAISLALHAWLLSQTPPPPAAPPAAQSLAATLRQVAAVAGEPGKPASATPARLPPMTAVATLPGEKVAVAATPGAIVAPQGPPPAAPMASLADAAASAVSVPEGKALVSTGPDADGVRQYRVNLATAARRFKRYPALALERGWSGSAQIEVAIAASGVPRQRLMVSSGHELLDEAALEMIGRSAQATILPASLRGQAFVVRLPVFFDLEEE